MRFWRLIPWICALVLIVEIPLAQTAASTGKNYEYMTLKGVENDQLFLGDQITLRMPLCFDSSKSKASQAKAKLERKISGEWRTIGSKSFIKSKYCSRNSKFQYQMLFKFTASQVGPLTLRIRYPDSTESITAQVYKSLDELALANAAEDQIAEKSGDIERILAPFKAGKLATSEVGIYLSKSNSAKEIISRNGNKRFEPASSIKTLIGLALMQDIANGSLKLDGPLTYFNYPNSSFQGGMYTCPIPGDEKPENSARITISEGYKMMMQNSDNRTTRAFVRLLGLNRINELAKSLGMKDTKLDQDFLGCGWRDGKQNQTTLADLSKLYEQANNPLILPETNSAFAAFWSGMLNFYQDGYFSNETKGKLTRIIDEEATAIGISSADLSAYKSKFRYRGKGGSYDMGCDVFAGNDGSCDLLRHLYLHRSFFFSFCIPIKALTPGPTSVDCDWYQGGWFAKGMIKSLPISTAREESLLFSAFLTALRPVIRTSLSTFRQ